MGIKEADSCTIQKSAFNCLTPFFILSLTLGPLYRLSVVRSFSLLEIGLQPVYNALD